MDIIEKLGIAAIPVIVAVVYVVVQGVKATPLDNKWLPVIAGSVGGILGIVGMLVMPDFPVTDPLSAFAYGAVSGLAATGVHQIFKQLSGEKDPIGTLSIDKETGAADIDFEVASLDELADKKMARVMIEPYEGKHEAE